MVLGKWLANKPKVIILDEPTRGLMLKSKSRDLQNRKTSWQEREYLSSWFHQASEVINMCDRVYIMSEGAYQNQPLSGVQPGENHGLCSGKEQMKQKNKTAIQYLDGFK